MNHEKWQEERNYRRVRNEGAKSSPISSLVDGMDVEVPEDVYLAYAQADRRERYIMEEQSSGNCSLWSRWRKKRESVWNRSGENGSVMAGFF